MTSHLDHLAELLACGCSATLCYYRPKGLGGFRNTSRCTCDAEIRNALPALLALAKVVECFEISRLALINITPDAVASELWGESQAATREIADTLARLSSEETPP